MGQSATHGGRCCAGGGSGPPSRFALDQMQDVLVANACEGGEEGGSRGSTSEADGDADPLTVGSHGALILQD